MKFFENKILTKLINHSVANHAVVAIFSVANLFLTLFMQIKFSQKFQTKSFSDLKKSKSYEPLLF